MIRGDQATSAWPWLRRGLPHGWLVDRRCSSAGFLNRDEAHILYNLALGFHGKRALEIGCLMGWSACHIALAGLGHHRSASEQPRCHGQRAGIHRGNQPSGRNPSGRGRLFRRRCIKWQRYSPRAGRFFSSMAIVGLAPVNDVVACLPLHATPDCAMVFHDLASPDVTDAVYLKRLGWRTRIYHTAQIMAVAWRGDVHPIAHQPDPGSSGKSRHTSCLCWFRRSPGHDDVRWYQHHGPPHSRRSRGIGEILWR